MVSISVPGMDGWGNPSVQLRGVLGSFPYNRSGLGTPFFVGKPCRDDSPSSIRTRHHDRKESVKYEKEVMPYECLNTSKSLSSLHLGCAVNK